MVAPEIVAASEAIDLMPLYAIIFAIAPFLIASIFGIFAKGPVAYIVAKLSAESKRGNHDVKTHCRFYGSLVALTVILIALIFIGRDYSIGWLLWLSIVTFPLPMLGSLIYSNTGERFLKK